MTTEHIITQLTNKLEQHLGITYDQIKGKTKAHEIITARHTFCWYLYRRHRYAFTLSAIGKLINRHHTSIMHAIQEVDWAIENKEPRFKFILTIHEPVYICPQCGCKRNHTPAVQ
jgi:chromosomal replication initiation ATPase DnaA